MARRGRRTGALLTVVGLTVGVPAGCSSFGSGDSTAPPVVPPAEGATTAEGGVTDASTTVPIESGSAIEASVNCGDDRSCASGSFCCIGGGKRCVSAGCDQPTDIAVTCDDSQSCPAGETCCVQTVGGAVRRISCEPRATCSTFDRFERCRDNGVTCSSCVDIKNYGTPLDEFTVKVCAR